MTTITSQSVRQTREFAASLAREARPGDVFALQGDLGAGKTEFVRGFVFARAPEAAVRSPSFSIVNTYEAADFPIFHFDFYRLGSYDELTEIGFEDYLAASGVCIVEWADLLPDALPAATKWIHFVDEGGEVRRIEMRDLLVF